MEYSVVVPTLNQSGKLRMCLERLSNLDFDQNLLEVLVIDNGSTDDTKGATLSFAGRIRNLRYHYCGDPGLMAARHMGADHAQGEILCYLDDDSLVAKDWMTGIAESFRDGNIVIAGGPCIPKYEADPPDWSAYFWQQTEQGPINGFLSLIDFGNRKQTMHPVHVFGCNYIIRKKTFYEFGGTCPDYYPEKYRQYIGDGESGLSLKILHAGHKALYHPKTRIDHLIPPARMTIDYFYWKRVYNGIHESYRAMRRQRELDGFRKPDGFMEHGVVRGIRRPLGKIKRGIQGWMAGGGSSPGREPPGIAPIRERMENGFQEGYSFHQKRFRDDPGLRDWVLRENYLGDNGKLPACADRGAVPASTDR